MKHTNVPGSMLSALVLSSLLAACADARSAETQTSAAIRAVMRDHMGEFTQCYERAREPTPSLAGRIVLAFALDREGRVTGPVQTEGMTEAPALGRCVAERVSAMSFARATSQSGATTVRYPIEFRP